MGIIILCTSFGLNKLLIITNCDLLKTLIVAGCDITTPHSLLTTHLTCCVLCIASSTSFWLERSTTVHGCTLLLRVSQWYMSGFMPKPLHLMVTFMLKPTNWLTGCFEIWGGPKCSTSLHLYTDLRKPHTSNLNS